MMPSPSETKVKSHTQLQVTAAFPIAATSAGVKLSKPDWVTMNKGTAGGLLWEPLFQ